VRRFLALGDSYTIGEGVAVQERWPSQAATMLRESGLDVAEPDLIARTAWTSDELADAVRSAQPSGPYDLVTLMVGVNDQYRGRRLEEFAAHFDPLLRIAITLAGERPARTIVISIPDWGAAPFAKDRDRALISRQIDAFNAWLCQRAAGAGTRWVDVAPISRQMLEDASLVAADGLHPSGEIHRRWALAIVPVAVQILGAGT